MIILKAPQCPLAEFTATVETTRQAAGEFWLAVRVAKAGLCLVTVCRGNLRDSAKQLLTAGDNEAH